MLKLLQRFSSSQLVFLSSCGCCSMSSSKRFEAVLCDAVSLFPPFRIVVLLCCDLHQVPAEAIVRLTQGRDAELKYLATRNGSSSNSNSRNKQRQESSTSRTNEGGGDSLARGGEANGSAGGARVEQPLRFESQQFSLLRRESDKFSDGDVSPRPRRETEAALQLLPVTGAGTGGAPQAPPGVANPSPLEDGHNAAAGTSASKQSPRPTLPGWDGPLLPEDGDAVLIADGFLVPGKADGGVYLVVPAAAEERRATAAAGLGVGGAGRGGESRAEGKGGAAAATADAGSSPPAERIVRLTNPKR